MLPDSAPSKDLLDGTFRKPVNFEDPVIRYWHYDSFRLLSLAWAC